MRDRAESDQLFYQHYASKWVVRQPQLFEHILDFIARTEDAADVVPWALIDEALDTIRKTTTCDSVVVCVLIIRAFVFGVPSVGESFFSSIFRSSAFI